MSLVDRIARGIQAQTGDVKPGSTMYLREAFAGSGTQAGKTVTVGTALGVDAFWSGVRCLSDAVGALPLKTYRKVTGGRLEMDGTTVYRLLHDAPNPEMTAIDCWSLVVTHLNTWGNAFLGKEKRGSQVSALWPIRPELVRVAREGGQKIYRLRDGDTLIEHDRTYTSAEIIHIRGMSIDGLVGLSPVAYHREAIGGGLAQDEFAHRFFSNSAQPRGVIEVEGELDDDAFRRLDRRWQASHRGGPNYHKIAILEAGAKFHPITMPLDDAQFIEQSNMTVQKMARILRVPPSMIGGDSGSSLRYSTVEGDAIHFERYSTNPWCVRIEQALSGDGDLFPAGPRDYSQFVRDALLRADTKTRAEVWAMALDPDHGWMGRHEVRSAEDLPPEQAPDTPRQVRDRMAAILAAAVTSRNGGDRHAVID